MFFSRLIQYLSQKFPSPKKGNISANGNLFYQAKILCFVVRINNIFTVDIIVWGVRVVLLIG